MTEIDELDALMSIDDIAEGSRQEASFMPLADLSKLWGKDAENLKELTSNPRRVAVDILRLFLANRTPITLWGPVGARKTRSIEAFSMEHDENGVPYQVITIMPSVSDPTVIHGVVYTSLDAKTGETVMKKSIPEVAMQIVDYYKTTGGLTVMFLDELTTCMPAQQHALLGILTHGKYGDYDISPYISIAMAANPEGTVSTVMPLGEQVVNRGGHIAWYGDVKLFLEEWSTGFGIKSLKPSDDVEWAIRALLDQDMESAFRAPDRWEAKDLVPYDLMEHTERSTTELAGMLDLIGKLFHSSPDFVRHFYMVEATRALQGNDWADRMSVVCSLEKGRVNDQRIIEMVSSAGVQPDWTSDTLAEKLGDSLYVHNGKRMTADKIGQIASSLEETATKDGPDSEAAIGDAARLALWAFASTAPSEGLEMSMHAHLTRLLLHSLSLYRGNKITKDQARPVFVKKNTIDALSEAIRRNQ